MNIFSESTYSFLNFFEIRKEKFKNSQFLVLFSRLLASILSGAVLFHQMVISQSKTYMKLNGWLREKFGRGKLSLRVQNLSNFNTQRLHIRMLLSDVLMNKKILVLKIRDFNPLLDK